VVVDRAGAACAFLLIGDHAGRSIPRRLGALGVRQADLDRHIAWDIGVEAMGLCLSAELGACFIRQAYSRLVIDCNRAPGSAASIPQVSDGTPISGNAGLSDSDIAARVGTIYHPYQARISQELDERRSTSLPTILVALHSFTPCLDGFDRPWRYGVLHRHDSPFSASVLAAMSAALGPEAGDNQPYAMDETDNTVPLHRAGRDIDYLELEVRQDLIADAAGQATIASEIGHFLVNARNDMVGP
jgi:predicted N-formylglutamate amidohydrolase